MTSPSRVPPISPQLIAFIEKTFPDMCPPAEATDQAVRIKMGEMNVVRFLRHQFDIQNTTTLIGS